MKKINFNIQLFNDTATPDKVMVAGYPVEFPDIPGYKFVVHKAHKSAAWILSEYSTGYSCGRNSEHSKTKMEAIEYSHNKIMESIEIFPEILKKCKIINF